MTITPEKSIDSQVDKPRGIIGRIRNRLRAFFGTSSRKDASLPPKEGVTESMEANGSTSNVEGQEGQKIEAVKALAIAVLRGSTDLDEEKMKAAIRNKIEGNLGSGCLVEGLIINQKEGDFMALIGLEGLRGAIVVSDTLDPTNKLPEAGEAENELKVKVAAEIKTVFKADIDKETLMRQVEANLKAKGLEILIAGLVIDTKEGEFQCITNVKGKRGVVAINGKL